MSKMIIN